MKTLINHIKPLFFLLAVFCLTIGISSCSDDDEIVNPQITVNEDSKTISITWNDIETSIKFSSTTAWTAIVTDDATGEKCDWITLSKYDGNGGDFSIPLLFGANDAETNRTATITLASGDVKATISVTQGDNPNAVLTMNESEIEDFEKYYKPKEFANIKMLRSDAKWSWFRAKQSEHFVVFWEPGFGEDPNAESVNPALRVDIDDLLEKAEQFYETNIATLKFAEVGQGKSYLDQYKMQIYLLYQSDWLATGAGYDDTIGALWINPSTCQPVGSTIAHEIGHSFQYQVYCDKLLNGATNDFSQGFRYGYEGSNGGNGFWEQCAQWQSFQDYPAQFFGDDVKVWEANYYRHFEHEWMRYASYWLQSYWVQKHGIEVVGEIWKQSQKPEDALSTYMRLYCGGNLETLYAELYDYATRMITYDIDGVREYKTSSAGNYTTKLYEVDDNYYQVAYANTPGTTGFNVIPLNVMTAGTVIKANFEGLAPGSVLAADDSGNIIDGDGATVGNATNYNATANTASGWRYGFVAIVNGNPMYAPMQQASTGSVSYTIPANTEKLYFVVMGAPSNYVAHGWNDDETDDEQWPYKVKFEGTDLLGSFYIDMSANPKDETFTYNIPCDATTAGYALGSIDLQSNGDIQTLAQAFVMKPTVLSGNTLSIANGTTSNPTEGKVALGLLQSDNTYSYTYTANGGFYCTADGNQGSWGNSDPIWFEYDKDNFVFSYGHYPNQTVAGQLYTIKPTLVYTKGGVEYKATFVINLQF